MDGTDAGDSGTRDAGDVDSGPTSDSGVDSAVPDTCGDLTLPPLALEDVSGAGWAAPLFLTQAPGSADLIVVDRGGEVFSIAPDGTRSMFVDVSAETMSGGERGLLGLAFHPDYDTNGRYFIYYTPSGASDNRVSEMARGSATIGATLVTIDDPESNHNGGMVAFGPDGFLYVGMGDGGGGGDRHGSNGNGQNLDTVLGKILRLDVDNAGGMYVAAGNPFVGMAGDDRIWAYGMRNPWRFSFDRATGDLYIGDVGQGEWEEIDFQPASSAGGENYGWRAYEGYEVFNMATVSLVADHTEPVTAYPHSGSGPITGCSVTGGYVYRGSVIPGLQGWYLYADFCSGDVAAFKMCDGAATGLQRVDGLSIDPNISSFGEDANGELYIIGFSYVRRIIAG